MTTTELRIGNHINAMHPHNEETTPYQTIVRTIYEDSVSTDAYGCFYGFNDPDITAVSGILLTEEMLPNFGFESMGEDSDGEHWEHDNFIFGYLHKNKYGFYFAFQHQRISRYFNTVHGLQNLFYATTGEELTLKQ